MSLLISGATIIDGVADRPIEEDSVWVEDGRIKAIGKRSELRTAEATQVIDARGKYLIPGMMDANVHLLLDMRLENLVRHEGHYEDLIIEAAQVALKNGLTTVFDTWGPLQALMEARDRINRGEVPGSRIFCAGNIIGLDGPFSEDFLAKTVEVASSALVQRINGLWVHNVGPALTWMTPDAVAVEIREYIRKRPDFIKFASSEHRVPIGASAFLAFSPQTQSRIVEEAHRAGLTAQAHTQSVEAVRVSIEAGCDIIQHCNITGPTPIPDDTLQMLVDRKTASTVFPLTAQRYKKILESGDVLTRRLFTRATVETNVRNLVQSGATLLLATDSGIFAAETASDPALGVVYSGEDNLFELGKGHFVWFKAMEENGLAPMAALKAATANTARAYRRDADLGTIEVGKIADMVLLEKDPLAAAEHYRSICAVIKDGVVVDGSALPHQAILTKVPEGTQNLAEGDRPLRGGFPSCCAAF